MTILELPRHCCKKHVVIICFILLTKLAHSQDYNQIVRRIDSLTKLSLPQSALAEIDKLDELAVQNNNSPQQIKAILYRMRFQSYLQENAIVGVVNSLKQRIATSAYPVKPVLESVLGNMYWNYYQRDRYQILQRSRLEKPGADFTLWDIQTLISAADNQFRLSLQDAEKEQSTPITVLDGVLTGDRSNRYLRPTLYDFLVQRALDFYLADETGLTTPKLPFVLTNPRLFGDSHSFAALNIQTTDTASVLYKGIKYLQQATKFHLQHQDIGATANLDMQRLQFVYGHTGMVNKDGLYLDAVTRISTQFEGKPMGATALEQLGLYYLKNDSLTKAIGYFKKITDNYTGTITVKEATASLAAIKQKQLHTTLESINVPGKPILGLVNYRNVKNIRQVLYKISATQFNILAAIHGKTVFSNGLDIAASDSVMHYLNKLTPVSSQRITLPDPKDFKNHAVEFKIAPMSTGNYVLVTSYADPADSAVINTRKLNQLVAFKVSSLAFVTRREPDNQVSVRVTDRESGKPLRGVTVTMAEDDLHKKTTDSNGACVFAAYEKYSFAIKLTTATDTLYTANNYYAGLLNNPDREEKHMVLFTDREIYRPGQTVYFKGIYIAKTDSKSTILTNEALNVSIKDINRNEITTIPVVTNNFGSFSGTFIIPQNILNGIINITTSTGSKYIRVEEYKRPTFQVEFQPLTGVYKPGDSVNLEGKVTAYSGYGISQAAVHFNINRQSYANTLRRLARYPLIRNNNSVITSDTVIADNQGKFHIKFKASPQEGVDPAALNYHFFIKADITDGSGETNSANTEVTVSENSLKLQTTCPATALAGDTVNAVVHITNLNGMVQKAAGIQLNIYSLKKPARAFKNRLWAAPDQFLLDSAQFARDFPDYGYKNEQLDTAWPVKSKIASLTAAGGTTAPEIFKLTMLKDEPTGTYKVVISAKSAQGDTVSETRYIQWVNKPAVPSSMGNFVIPVNLNAGPLHPASFLVGTGVPGYVLMEQYNGRVLKSSQWINFASGKQRMIEVPAVAGEQDETIQFLSICHNRVYMSYQHLQNATGKLNIKLLSFRDKLQPGEKEQWRLQITGKDGELRSAEMVADMYDASLDAIGGQNRWTTNLNFNSYPTNYFSWYSNNFVSQRQSNSLEYNGVIGFINTPTTNYERLNMFGYNYYGGYNAGYQLLLRGRGNGLAENMIYKADTVEYRSDDYRVRIDEPVGNSDMSMALHEVSVAQQGHLPADVLEEVQAVDSYGDQAAETGNINVRKNFNETAFFYPQLHTDEQGQILIDFTMPEALTQWRFKAFAHTRDLQTGYIESNVVTQKKLSISANMPRFLRTGDTITVSARLANLTAQAIKGNVQLQLFNGLNMQPVKLLLNPADGRQTFSIAAASTQSVNFRLVIPAGLDALDYKITADAGNFSDGEENTLPVLSNQILVTETMPMMVRAGEAKSFSFNKLVNYNSTTLSNKTLTLEYTQNPTWYAIQALPYMMEFPYECSEQLFNRYYANSMAASLVNHLPVIKQVFEQWKNNNSAQLLSNLEKNQELKATLVEETPWLRDAENESDQKKRIALLFDLNKMSYELKLNLDMLQKKQLPDGGFPWFGGDRADSYITNNILAGIGQLYHSHIADATNRVLKSIADKALSYMDNTLIAKASIAKGNNKYEGRIIQSDEIYAYYARSYFADGSLSTQMQALLANYLSLAANQWQHTGVYEQGMIALTMLRYQKPEVARRIIKSLNETAQHSQDMGMYWAKNQAGYYWYQAPIEAQSLMMELFTEAGNNDKAIEEMKIWLLRSKQTNNWGTTKATAAACYALLLKGDNWIAGTGTPEIKLGGTSLSNLKPNIQADAGTGYFKTAWTGEQIKPDLGKAEIHNNGKTIAWGALYWQYLENLDKITPSQTDLQLERKYFIEQQTPRGPVLVAVDAAHQPKTGDLLKVMIYLKAGRDFEYLQLKDMRPAGTEPIDVLSAYKYQSGLFYYQVTRDVATNFFISSLSKGNYVFEYQLRVVQPGHFSTGICTIQSMYAPEFSAHSEGQRLTMVSR